MRSSQLQRVGLPVAVATALLATLALQVWAIAGQSLTGDESHHLIAGYQALAYGQNRLNLEHPPLVKMVAALPLLVEDEAFSPPLTVDRALAEIAVVHRRPELLGRARLRGRALILLLFGLPLLGCCFLYGRRLGGPAAGVLLVLLLGLSLPVLPNLSTLQTDTAVSLAFVGVVLAGASFRRRPTWLLSALLGALLGLGLASKHSALLLLPVAMGAVLVPGRALPLRRRLAAAVLAGTVALGVVTGVYALANRSYDPEVGRQTIRTYCANRGTLAVEDRLAGWQETLLWVEQRSPLAAQWLLGVLGVSIQNDLGIYPSFAFGEIDSGGRWWYFPALLLAKTPLAILVAAAVLLARSRWRAMPRSPEGRAAAVATAIYAITSLASSYNLGVRHLLPVLPFLLAPLAVGLARHRGWTVVIVAALLAESVAVAPTWMSATNTWWLGDYNPTRLAFTAGNGENRQSFLALARALERRGIAPVRVFYPALAAEELHAYLPDATLLDPTAVVEPGWYAVSITVEQLVPALLRARPERVHDYVSLHRAAELWHPLWQEVLRRGVDHGTVAGTFRLYQVEG